MRRIKSIYTRLKMLLLVCFVPMTVMLLYLLFMVSRFSVRYDEIMQNIVSANAYNQTFKEEFDYTMYIITVNSDRAAMLVDLEQPRVMLQEVRSTFKMLQERGDEGESEELILGILKNLDNLELHASEIERDAKIVGMYDTNMYRLDMDIRILTELIQEGIQDYISKEIGYLESLRNGLRSEVRSAVAAGVCMLILILGSAVFMSRRIMSGITEGFRQLLNVTRAAGAGEFSVRTDLKKYDVELAQLGDGFNQMVEHLDTLVEDIRIEQLNIRNMEQKLLQAQINPHFLYNTLDAIVWLAEEGDDKHVIMMVTALSDFFRTTLSKGRDIITVEEEYSHILSYLKIQQFRYQDILEYEIDIPKELYLYQIKKLMLQPLVENALYHGIKNKRGMGRIRVAGWKEGGDLFFEVSDNGIGMTKERLMKVRSEVSEAGRSRDDNTAFGLYNVAERIRLNYGSDYGLTIDSTYGEGTQVRVRVPARLMEEEKTEEGISG